MGNFGNNQGSETQANKKRKLHQNKTEYTRDTALPEETPLLSKCI